MKLLLFFVVSIMVLPLVGQEKKVDLDCLKGVYEGDETNYYTKELDTSMVRIKIINGNRQIFLYHYLVDGKFEAGTYTMSYLGKEDIIGFYDWEDGELTSLSQLQSESNGDASFVEVFRYDERLDTVISAVYYQGVSCIEHGLRLYLFSGLHIWSRLKALPYDFAEFLYEQQLSLKRDYFQEFLDQEVLRYCGEDTLMLFAAPNEGPSGAAVPSGDLVEVLDRQEGWVQLRALRTGAVGWAEAPCLE